MFEQPTLPFDREAAEAQVFSGTRQYSRRQLHPYPEDLALSPYEKIPTPTDDRGLVDIPQLIQQVGLYVRPDYEWRGRPNKHHVFWYEKLYTERTLFRDNTDLSRRFRSMALHQIELPVELHDFLHQVTLPVEVPSDEVMEYRVESWDIACKLFNSVSVLREHRRACEAQLARKVNSELVDQKMRIIENCVRRADSIPKEFQLASLRPFRYLLGVEKLEWITHSDLNRAKKTVRRYNKVSSQGALRLHQQELLVA